MTQSKLRAIVDQLESCNYECIAGPLENSAAFQDLRRLAYPPEDLLIQDVQTKTLTRHLDERGFFCEIIRQTDDFFDGFGQWAYSRMHTGTVKAFHIHQFQTDYFFVPLGEAKVVLHDCRPDSPTHNLTNEFFMGDGRQPYVLKIPPGVAHGIKAITPTYLFYITSRVYDPADEGRIPHNDPTIGYDWLKGPEIK